MRLRASPCSSVAPIADHGGSLSRAAALHGIPVEDWIDLSTGINPNPYPLPSFPPAVWSRLPDDDLMREFELAAQVHTGATAEACIIVAGGSQALIQSLPWLYEGAKVHVLVPTYAEHARCWKLAGHRVHEGNSLGDADADVVVVVNPNNPDGRILQPALLLALAERQAERGGLLVVDEAFADVTPEISMAPFAGRPGLVILRSFGKFFGLAGVRLGFALAPSEPGTLWREMLGPWAASGLALAAGTVAMKDRAWCAATQKELKAGAERLDRLLEKAGLTLVGGTSLFRLTESGTALETAARLAEAGILVRTFLNHPTRLRIGLPKNDTQWMLFERILMD